MHLFFCPEERGFCGCKAIQSRNVLSYLSFFNFGPSFFPMYSYTRTTFSSRRLLCYEHGLILAIYFLSYVLQILLHKKRQLQLAQWWRKWGKVRWKTGTQEGAWRQIDNKMKEEKGRTQISSACGIIASQHIATRCA